LIDIPVPRQQLVHIYPGMEELGSVYYPTLAINASVNQFANILPNLGGRRADPPWSALRRQGRQAYLDWTKPVFSPGRVNLSEVICSLNEFLPDDAIIANGAGNYTAWVHRFYRYRTLGSQLAPTAGSMGYGLPAAVTAKLVQPHRRIRLLAGAVEPV
jgi:acetolactate synthase-1/2/3 large subunit